MKKQYAIVETFWNFKLDTKYKNHIIVHKIFTNRREAENYLKILIDNKLNYYKKKHPDKNIEELAYLSIVPDVNCTIHSRKAEMDDYLDENRLKTIGFNRMEIIEVREHQWEAE